MDLDPRRSIPTALEEILVHCEDACGNIVFSLPELDIPLLTPFETRNTLQDVESEKTSSNRKEYNTKRKILDL
jgi:hypothetical protein